MVVISPVPPSPRRTMITMLKYWQQPIRKQLLRLALITSPLLAIFRLAPVAILSQEQIVEIASNEQHPALLLVFAGSFISLNVFLMWLVNIKLFTKDIETLRPARPQRALLRPYLLSFAFTVGLLLIPIAIDYFLDPIFPFKRDGEFNVYPVYPILGNLANNSIVLLIMHLVLTRDKENRLALSNMQLEVSNLMAQQAQLKHQLQPHFLFNALYTLQLLISKEPLQAKQYLQRLAGFLRSSIQHARQDTISIGQEVQFCENYLALQKVRFGDALSYEIGLSEGEKQQGELPIFTLQVLVENAIKHNAFDAEQPLHISIKSHEGDQLLVENNLLPKPTGFTTSNGFGLRNLGERFRLLSFPEPIVETSSEEMTYRVYVPFLAP